MNLGDDSSALDYSNIDTSSVPVDTSAFSAGGGMTPADWQAIEQSISGGVSSFSPPANTTPTPGGTPSAFDTALNDITALITKAWLPYKTAQLNADVKQAQIQAQANNPLSFLGTGFNTGLNTGLTPSYPITYGSTTPWLTYALIGGGALFLVYALTKD